MDRIAAVTGARGFIGSRLCDFLRERGYRVVELRRDVGTDRADARRFSLEAPVDPAILRGVDLLVHTAYDPRPVSWEAIRRVNLEGSLALFDAAAEADVRRVVHLSTMSSFEGCRSMYGRVKLEIERDALRRGFGVLRPGLVHGPAAGGMVGSLERMVGLAPLLPMVGRGGQRLYLIHVEDLCRLIERVATLGEAPAAPLIAAHEQSWPFARILKTLARSRGRRVWLCPVPWRLVWAPLAALEALGIRIGFRADSVVSLVNQDPDPDFSATRELGIELREFGAETTDR